MRARRFPIAFKFSIRHERRSNRLTAHFVALGARCKSIRADNVRHGSAQAVKVLASTGLIKYSVAGCSAAL